MNKPQRKSSLKQRLRSMVSDGGCSFVFSIRFNLSDVEMPKIQEAIQQTFFTAVLGMVMSKYFNVHHALLMQSVMLPLNSTDNPVVRKYIFGATKESDGSPMYGAVTEDPLLAGNTATAETTEKKEEEKEERVEIISETVNGVEKPAASKRNAKKASATKESLHSIDE